MTHNTSLILALVCACPLLGQGPQSTEQALVNVESLHEDLDVLYSCLDAGHGGAYQYLSRGDLAASFAAAKASITSPISEFEFVRRLAPIIASLNDGHTELMPSRQLRRKHDAAAIWFPFAIRILRNRIYLFPYDSDTCQIPVGSRLIAINGVAANVALAEMLAAMSSDGWIETSKLRALEGPREFSAACHLRFGPEDRYHVEVQAPRGQPTTSVTISGWTYANVLEASRKSDTTSAREFGIQDGIGVLRVKSFKGRNASDVSFEEFLESSFSRLRDEKVSGLILDLRGNGGGQDKHGKEMFAYLAKGPFDYYKHLEVRARDFGFLEHTDARGKEPPPGMLRKNGRGTSDLTRHPNLGKQNPKAPGFAGKVVILMDGGSFSTTSEFLAVAKQNLDAVFVGEEGGGTNSGNTSGMVPTVTLPNTKVTVRLPLVRYVTAVDAGLKGRGTLPDYAVEPTIADVLAGIDPALRLARELARR